MSETAQHRPTLVVGGLRARFFSRRSDEVCLLEPILPGQIRLPAGDVGEPFCDTTDIADAAPTVRTAGGHLGAIDELADETVVRLLVDLFGTVHDGRNTAVGDGVEHVRGRAASESADHATAPTAATGVRSLHQPEPGSPG